MLSDNIDYFKSKPVNIPKITILLDHGYHPEKIIEELKKIYPGLRTKIRLKLSPKPSKAEKKQQSLNASLHQIEHIIHHENKKANMAALQPKKCNS